MKEKNCLFSKLADTASIAIKIKKLESILSLVAYMKKFILNDHVAQSGRPLLIIAKIQSSKIQDQEFHIWSNNFASGTLGPPTTSLEWVTNDVEGGETVASHRGYRPKK